MSPREEELLARLRATFKAEAAEHLQTIATGLFDLEKGLAPDEQRERIALVFRAAHSLKGAARAVNLPDVESLCQSLEDTFAGWKRDATVPSATAFDALHRSLDAIAASVETAAGARAVAPPPKRPAPSATAMPEPAVAGERTPLAETVRISVAKLDAQLLEAEEMLTAKLTTGQRAAELRELAAWFEAWSKEWARVRPDARALRHARPRADSGTERLGGLLDFCDWNFDRVKVLQSRIATLAAEAQRDHRAIGKLVDDLLDESKKLLMLPFATLTAIVPRVIRDVCREQGKEATVALRGEDIEIDKRILEEMKDPLVHLLRNCVDHGVEKPAERAALGKAPGATITVAASRVEGGKVELLVEDDGAGIDVEKVKAATIERGLLSPDAAKQLSETDALRLAMLPDVSTSPMITRLSGRGLGLAIARERAEHLGGSVAISSRRGAGTTIRVVLPVSLATTRGVIIETGGRNFVVPSIHVERVARVPTEDVQTVEGRETISLGGRTLALTRLDEVLGLPHSDRPEPASARALVVILGAGDRQVAFVVDAVSGEQEVLVKRLGRPLARVRNIAGATVLGSGQVVPILHVSDLLKSARRFGGPARRADSAAAAATVVRRSVLVVEDSITSRMLLKAILESAGYAVRIAVDGAEALALVRTEPCDLVVSDVEMPRMSGFDLTRAIRADVRLAELPVILVTALERREDREHGIDAGASAYLVKSSFDQGSLLEAVRRLI